MDEKRTAASTYEWMNGGCQPEDDLAEKFSNVKHYRLLFGWNSPHYAVSYDAQSPKANPVADKRRSVMDVRMVRAHLMIFLMAQMTKTKTTKNNKSVTGADAAIALFVRRTNLRERKREIT